ncbi:Hypothetical predicted protein, partial [Podarcis lilfordi]
MEKGPENTVQVGLKGVRETSCARLVCGHQGASGQLPAHGVMDENTVGDPHLADKAMEKEAKKL